MDVERSRRSQRSVVLTPRMILCRGGVDQRYDKNRVGIHRLHRHSRLSHSSDGTFRSPGVL
jgi:hypothetical protein